MSISIDTVRIGKKYILKNYGEVHRFEVLSRTGEENFEVKDMDTLEKYSIKDLYEYGRGKDYLLDELK